MTYTPSYSSHHKKTPEIAPVLDGENMQKLTAWGVATQTAGGHQGQQSGKAGGPSLCRLTDSAF